MLTGIVDKNRYGAYVIRVYGYPEVAYYYYTKRDALRKYRRNHNLVGRKIDWLDMCKRSITIENGVIVWSAK